MKGLPGQAPHLDLSATQIQLLKSRCSNSLRIALKVCLNSSPMRVSQIREETDKDTTLLALHEIIMHGWPEKRSNCPASLHAYWNYRDEPTVADGLILKGTRIVIPESLQPNVLKQLHYAHQGSEKCKLMAKGSVFWANINRDIEELVKSCPHVSVTRS